MFGDFPQSTLLQYSEHPDEVIDLLDHPERFDNLIAGLRGYKSVQRISPASIVGRMKSRLKNYASASYLEYLSAIPSSTQLSDFLSKGKGISDSGRVTLHAFVHISYAPYRDAWHESKKLPANIPNPE